jgi:hypothetical protein
MGFLGFPLALLALTAIPVLGGIYWLRNRFRRMPVSSLILWIDHSRPKEGGRRIQRIQTPLIFFIELLAILLLVAAAVGPMVPSKDMVRHLIVILDDSYSMQAGDGESPRQLAIEAVKKELQRQKNVKARFILAADRPQVLGSAVRTTKEATELLTQWQCQSARADIGQAIVLALELARQWTDILVISDQPPPNPLDESTGIRWVALGKKLPNIAIINASRTITDNRERVLLEVANLSGQTGRANLIIETLPEPTPSQVLKQQELILKPDHTQRIIVDLKENVPPLQARLQCLTSDAIAIDNKVVLLSEGKPPIRTAISIANDTLREMLAKALQATTAATIVTTDHELLFTDKAILNTALANKWQIRIASEETAISYTGPYILDKSHPLTEGITLQGVIWAAGKSQDKLDAAATPLPGRAVIMAGDISLVTVDQRLDSSVNILMRLQPELSTLQNSANWPILISNIIRWRAAEKPGPDQINLRLGSTGSIKLPQNTQEITIDSPANAGETIDYTQQAARTINIKTTQTGLYTITATIKEESADKETTRYSRWQFAVNALHKNESDLANCSTGNWGNWQKSESTLKAYHNTAWIFLLLAIAVLLCHLALLTRQGGTRQ